jgi:acetolactate synthase-1/2/3 large subunit
MKYSDYFMQELHNNGYSTCFYVGGGNSMHLLESASRYFNCVPVVHEVSAAIAAEYFNHSANGKEKAFALVTAGPGLTNLVTGIAGAWLDSRELLVVGGQAKSTTLSKGKVRQVGHQEIDGVGIVREITKVAFTIASPLSSEEIRDLVSKSWTSRPGPVFIEVCLDVSAMDIDPQKLQSNSQYSMVESEFAGEIDWERQLRRLLEESTRPLILLGGGVSKTNALKFIAKVEKLRLPIACTWTGADKCGFDYPYFVGRPNTYGMRWSNIIQQQADLLIAVGTSLGFQQTGFNIEEFLPIGKLVHVDIDKNELEKSNPKDRMTILEESGKFLNTFGDIIQKGPPVSIDWIEFIQSVKKLVPVLEAVQVTEHPTVSPHSVIQKVSQIAGENDAIVAASSGGTFTATMQVFQNKANQILIGNKGLASMGYGLAGAIGIAINRKNIDSKCILFEGDGGFAQNLQELGTVIANDLNLKIFITCNDGYASIRTSQMSYFQGHYLGCDRKTGLALPNWEKIMEAFGIPYMNVTSSSISSDEFTDLWESKHASAFLIRSDPNQTYLPKILSKVRPDGTMTSTALHDMYPSLPEETEKLVFKFLNKSIAPAGS